MKKYILFFVLVCISFSCSDFIDVGESNYRIPQSVVFGDDNTAVSAIMGIYYEISSSQIYTGDFNSMSSLAGLSADDLVDYNSNPGIVDFERNDIMSNNANISSLWNSLYKVIYQCNSMLEGLEVSTGLTNVTRSQLIGESKFIRAFCYFYLVNLFGDIPIVTSTDYKANSVLTRESVSDVYTQIVSDLISAKDLMSDSYVTPERVRPNSFSASALLSKVYLFLGDWVNTELESSRVIENSEYGIVDEVNDVFARESKEAIWQIAPVDGLSNTNEAMYYVIAIDPSYLVLRDDVVNEFDMNDKRLNSWIGSIDVSGLKVYYPFKYKLQEYGTRPSQFSQVIRLSEVYLIRSESRVMENDLLGAVSDLDVVRRRAGIPLIADIDPDIDGGSLFQIIQSERRRELFAEWGIRWFDLKRLNTVVQTLSPIKEEISNDDSLYPVPEDERRRNPKLGLQNPGY